MRAQHHGKGSDRFRMVAPERVAQRGLSIPARRVLDEDSEAGKRPQEPRHRRAMRMRGICQFPNALWAAGEEIGKGQLGGHMDRLHRHCSWPQHLHHLHRWGDWLCLRFSVAHPSLLSVYPDITSIHSSPLKYSPEYAQNRRAGFTFETNRINPGLSAIRKLSTNGVLGSSRVTWLYNALPGDSNSLSSLHPALRRGNLPPLPPPHQFPTTGLLRSQ